MNATKNNAIELILTMVGRSAEVVAPEEKEESFDEYCALVRSTQSLPEFNPISFDDSAKGLIDSAFFYGVSLTFLGQVALVLLQKIQEVALEKGVETIFDLLKEHFTKKDKQVAPLKQEIEGKVLLSLKLPPGVSPEDVVLIVNEQLKVLASISGSAAQ